MSKTMIGVDTPHADETSLSQRWYEWGQTSLGTELLAQETEALAALIPDQYFQVGVQLGELPSQLFSSLNTGTSICVQSDIEMMSVAVPSEVSRVLGQAELLPFGQHSVDLAILPHTLELCDDPLRALREISQILVPEGVLAMTGFNPFSWWGMRAVTGRWRGHAPWAGRYFRVKALQDWLSLLGLELIAGQMLDYRPPIQRKGLRRQLSWLDKMGDRWWPGLGGVYVLVVKKQVYGKTATRPAPKRLSRWLGVLSPAPVSRVKDTASKKHTRPTDRLTD